MRPIIIILLLFSVTAKAQPWKRYAPDFRHYHYIWGDTLKQTYNLAYNATTWNGNTGVPTMDAIRDKIESLPIVLKGTTNWTPGTVSAGSSASTTLTVTGAVVGDPVTVCKLSGYSNGEIYDAFVSATNTVTIRVHNVSTGSANYSSAADYNVVVHKY